MIAPVESRTWTCVAVSEKIESGVVKPHVVAFPLMPLIENVVASESAIAAQKNLDLRVVRTSASVRSDPALLERMLKNLVTNAIRYTEHGRIVVGCRRAGHDALRLEIVDSGIGISTEDQERIFEEYYQLAGNSAQVREAGQFFTTTIADEPLLIVRGNDGVLRAMSNVCRHRAGPIARGEGKDRKSVV